jgi:hypothetical protein
VTALLRIDVEDPATRNSTRVDTCVWLVWTTLTLTVVAYHETWRDELQAWGIARDSRWPWDVVRNTAYEGHPPLWHLMLWTVSQASRSPGTVQLCGWACASAAVWLVLRHLPFTLPVRVLVVFGYLPLYEMGVIARSYSLLFLLAVAVLALDARRPTWIWVQVLLLGAMSLTLVVAIPLVAALAVAIALRHRAAPLRRLVLPAGALAGVTLLSLWLARPPSRDGRRLTMTAGDGDQARRVLAGPLRIVVPVFEHVGTFWGRFLSDRLEGGDAWLGVVVLVGAAVLLRRSRRALAVWVLGSLGYLGATYALSLPMAPRQLTVLWLTLLGAAWIAGSDAVEGRLARRAPSPGTRETRTTRVIVSGVLLIGVYATAWPAATEVRHPFSGSDGAADWLRARGAPTTAVYCATALPTCSSVALQLDTPAYANAEGEPFTYVVWRSGWRRTIPLDQVPADARRLAQRLDSPVVVVALYPDLPAGCSGGWISPPTIVSSERVAVCSSDDLSPSAAEGP